jgi:RNA polymerase sigma factor (TIGR02999 family)
MSKPTEDVTLLLEAVFAGDQDAGRKLFSIVYRELHALAHTAMRREIPGNPLQTTALVHEAYIRLVQYKDERWENRAHFFSTAARAMRRILVDEARSRKAAKRGYGHCPVPLDELKEPGQKEEAQDPFEDLEALDRALDKLSAQESHKRKCTVVELRFFVGLTLEQTADVLAVSIATVKRDWEFTRAWLRREVNRGLGEGRDHDA